MVCPMLWPSELEWQGAQSVILLATSLSSHWFKSQANTGQATSLSRHYAQHKKTRLSNDPKPSLIAGTATARHERGSCKDEMTQTLFNKLVCTRKFQILKFKHVHYSVYVHVS